MARYKFISSATFGRVNEATIFGANKKGIFRKRAARFAKLLRGGEICACVSAHAEFHLMLAIKKIETSSVCKKKYVRHAFTN